MSKIAMLRQKIADLEFEISAIQQACAHPEIVLEVKTGTVCLTSDYDELARKEYRTTTYYHCGLCDKQWSESEEHT